MKITLIIITYNRPDALNLIFRSILRQTVYPDQIVIADDGSGEETSQVIKNNRKELNMPVSHVWHEDKGFRGSAIRNKAIIESVGDYLIFSDGDLFFHPRFVEDYRRNARYNEALIGSRVFLTEKATIHRLRTLNPFPLFPFFSPSIDINRENSVRFPIVSRLLKPIHFNKNLRGGLLGAWKKDVEKINGWNEEFSGWGFEDTELVARLWNSGILLRKLKFQAITYHLWHKVQKRDMLATNQKILAKSINEGLTWCKQGLVN